MQNNNHKPPRPPPLSVSQPSKPPPAQPQPQGPQPQSKPQAQPQPQPKPLAQAQPQPKPQAQPQPKPKPKVHFNSNSDESPKSPLRSESPRRSDEHELDFTKNGSALVVHEKYYSPLTSPAPVTPPKDGATLDNFSSSPHHVVSFNRREEAPPQTGVVPGDASGGGERKGRVGVGGERKGVGRGVRFPGVENVIGRKSRKEEVVEKVNLGVRVLEIVFCLISFSVMAADRTQGWSGDSFDRYKEYRFCLSVSILGFLYSAFQAYDVVSHMVSGKHVITHHLRYQFDFVMDQILAYLLISASSAAASRVDDWQANWGKDEFTEKASASISMAFLAFLGFAMSSLISGYNLCNRDLP